MSCLYISKLKLPFVFQKRNWNFRFAFEHLWPDFLLDHLPFPLKFHPAALERQFNYLKCFVTMPLWQSNNLGIILCHQRYLLYCLSLTCWCLLPFLGSIWFFFYNFKNIKHLTTSVNSNAASREPLSFLLIWMYHRQLTEEPDRSKCQMVSFIHAATPVLAPTLLHVSSGPNQDLLCVQQSDAASFCENYAKL